MKALKILLIAALGYAAIVVAFESMIGYMQPSGGTTLAITTFDADGPHTRVVSGLRSSGQLYVAANHWPRAWYRRALASPDIEATVDGVKGSYRAVPVEGAEHERVESENRHSIVFKLLTGFPPRYFVRLDPRETSIATPPAS